MKYECERIKDCKEADFTCYGVEMEVEAGYGAMQMCHVNSNFVRLVQMITWDWDE